MADTCPYADLSGSSTYCRLAGTSQGDYQKENYCWKSDSYKGCANYQGASDQAKMEKRR